MKILNSLLSATVLLASLFLILSCGGGENGDSDDDNSEESDDDDSTDIDDDDDDDDNDDDDDTPPVDTTDMALVPVGEFQMGCEPEYEGCSERGLPRHPVFLYSYFIDIFEVTNSQYAEFLNDGGDIYSGGYFQLIDEMDGHWTATPGFENYPVTSVQWEGAKYYCEWLGKRLPTEAEWEKAAKGAQEHYMYPWGDEPIDNAANTSSSSPPSETTENWTTPVGYYDGSDHGGEYQTSDGRSPYGVHDMTGNVIEWVSDQWDADYYSSSPYVDPQGGTNDDNFYVVRSHEGIGPLEACTTFLRNGFHSFIESYTGVGFRCALDGN